MSLRWYAVVRDCRKSCLQTPRIGWIEEYVLNWLLRAKWDAKLGVWGSVL